MTRREHLATISVVAAHALFSDVLEAFARAAAAPDVWRPQALAPDQGPLLAEVVETILPATDSPAVLQVQPNRCNRYRYGYRSRVSA